MGRSCHPGSFAHATELIIPAPARPHWPRRGAADDALSRFTGGGAAAPSISPCGRLLKFFCFLDVVHVSIRDRFRITFRIES